MIVYALFLNKIIDNANEKNFKPRWFHVFCAVVLLWWRERDAFVHHSSAVHTQRATDGKPLFE